MALHPWEKVEVDGGPVGTEVFWHCPVCGAGGGPVIGDRRMRPFLPGHGVRVSEDCAEAQKQARDHGETMIGELRARWRNPRGEHYHYASLFHDALRWNPQVTNVTALLDLLREVDSPTVTSALPSWRAGGSLRARASA